jgi:hypothetical protein
MMDARDLTAHAYIIIVVVGRRRFRARRLLVVVTLLLVNNLFLFFLIQITFVGIYLLIFFFWGDEKTFLVSLISNVGCPSAFVNVMGG